MDRSTPTRVTFYVSAAPEVIYQYGEQIRNLGGEYTDSKDDTTRRVILPWDNPEARHLARTLIDGNGADGPITVSHKKGITATAQDLDRALADYENWYKAIGADLDRQDAKKALLETRETMLTNKAYESLKGALSEFTTTELPETRTLVLTIDGLEFEVGVTKVHL